MQTLEQQVYLSKLMGYDYLIQYCIERHNVVANALSRSDGQCLILSVPQFAFLDELQRNLSSSEAFHNLVRNINDHPTEFCDYRIHEGLVIFKGCI